MLVTPTLALSYAEAESCWTTWQWQDRPGPEAARLHPNVLTAVPEALGSALPDAGEGESVTDALARSRSGPFGDPDATAQFVDSLADGLIPGPVVLELLSREQRDGRRPRLQIWPSPSLAQVPWPMLRVRLNADGSRRAQLSSIADVCLGVPRDAVADALDPAEGEGVVAILDPRVPGHATASSLGSVLGQTGPDDLLAGLIEQHGSRRRDQDRQWLRDQLPGTDRFLFLGHVSAAGVDLATGAASSMHLCCVDDDGRHAPLSAADILSDDRLRFPRRVALLGCGSGTDLRYPEPMGLALACVLKGARLVTSTIWTLPTDASIEGQPLRRLVRAVDEAHGQADPVAAMNAWQTERGYAWLTSGEPADSPLLWASAATYVA